MDLGQVGRFSDGGVLANSTFGESLMNGSLPYTLPQPLPGTGGPSLPYCIVGDEAFPLHENMLRPKPEHNLPGKHILLFSFYKFCTGDQAVFNYRLRLIIENSFEIMAARETNQ